MDKFVDGTGQTWFYCYEVGLWFNNLNFIGIGYRYFEIHPDVPEDTGNPTKNAARPGGRWACRMRSLDDPTPAHTVEDRRICL